MWKPVSRSREAAKQSKRSCVPDVSSVQCFEDVCSGAADYDRILLPVVHAAEPLLSALAPEPDGRRLLCLVGPEGGFTPDEVQYALSAGAHPVRLTKTVLRASTAAVVAAAIILHAFPS